MDVNKVPPFSTATNLPASEGKARRRRPFVPTVSITFRTNLSGLEAGACDGVEEVEVEEVDVDEEPDGDGEVVVDVVDELDVDDDDVLGVDDVVEDVVEVDAGDVPGTCCTYHAATYP